MGQFKGNLCNKNYSLKKVEIKGNFFNKNYSLKRGRLKVIFAIKITL